jgi:hypothetical protein
MTLNHQKSNGIDKIIFAAMVCSFIFNSSCFGPDRLDSRSKKTTSSAGSNLAADVMPEATCINDSFVDDGNGSNSTSRLDLTGSDKDRDGATFDSEEKPPRYCPSDTCPADKCESVKAVCGVELIGATVQTSIQMLEIHAGLAGCLELTGAAANTLEIAILVDKIRTGTWTTADLASIYGEYVCDAIGCLKNIPALAAIAAGPMITMAAGCGCYRMIKGALNCSIAQSECQIQQNEQPVAPGGRPCGGVTVQHCVRENGNLVPVTPAEIAIQCRNRALTSHLPANQLEECVMNCVSKTLYSAAQNPCEGPNPLPSPDSEIEATKP